MTTTGNGNSLRELRLTWSEITRPLPCPRGSRAGSTGDSDGLCGPRRRKDASIPELRFQGTGRLFQFASEVSCPSEQHGVYCASISPRLTGRSPGDRRPGNDERQLHMCPGGVFGFFNAHSSAYGQLSARSWWPASEAEWLRAEPYSFWDPADVGLTPNNWSSFPKAAAPNLVPFLSRNGAHGSDH